MAQSVSSDALWGKLSELDKKMDQLVITNKTSTLDDQKVAVKSDFQKEKDEIIKEIQEQIYKLGKHSDINFGAANQNIGTVNDTIRKILNIVSHTRKHQRETAELLKMDAYFNFRFFKIKKTSLVIAMLSLLVLILTLFCMKQQNDYALLMDEYYRKSLVIEESDTELKVFEEQNLKKQKRNDIGKNKVQKIHDKK